MKKILLPLVAVICFSTIIVPSNLTIGQVSYRSNSFNTTHMKLSLNNTAVVPLKTSGQTSTYFQQYEWNLKNIGSLEATALVSQQRSIEVAVIDTGVDYNHVALKDKLDLANAYNFISNSKDVLDDNGHGTHVAGIITTNLDYSNGLTSVTNKLDIKILPIKVLDAKGSSYSDKIALGIRYAVDKKVDIINLSIGGNGLAPDIDAALTYASQKGIIVVASAGNDGKDTSSFSPASNSTVITVGAIKSDNTHAAFSNTGVKLDLSAPGDHILSTYLNNTYAFMSGTSMATPIVSGVIAILKAQKPELSVDEIKDILYTSSTDLGLKGKDNIFGYGKIDALKAVQSIKLKK